MLVIISLALLVLVFASLCIVCDEHLIPAVDVFIKQFDVPEEVAAVTLVAFGSAAPEIMLNSVGAMQQNSSLSLPSVLGRSQLPVASITLHLYPTHPDAPSPIHPHKCTSKNM